MVCNKIIPGERGKSIAKSRLTCAMGAAFGIVLASTSLAPLQLRAQTATATAAPVAAGTSKPNILVIYGDDIGQTNISAYSLGVVGYKRRTPTASPGPA